MKAILRNYRQSPRKVRLVADSVRGVSVKKAVSSLDTLNKKSAFAVKKLLNSAVANAKENFGKTREELFIKTIKVDEGRVLKRFMPRAFGRATAIHKRLSHVTLELGSLTQDVKEKPVKKDKKDVEKNTIKKTEAKKVPKNKE
ncbi:MAG TPA: 50S ribosomal protein L22 [Candidatus Yonathbacteria bacterium]|nr:50S ribosomal protein L22 [Candidatus Yonathbacteria bacterium]